MPRGAGRLPKLIGGLLGGGVIGGAMGGVLWHVIDPPSIAILGVEALLLTVVVALLLPHSPQTPNLNLIPQLTNAH